MLSSCFSLMPEVAHLPLLRLIRFFLTSRNIKCEQTMEATIWLKRLREKLWNTLRSLRVRKPQFGSALPFHCKSYSERTTCIYGSKKHRTSLQRLVIFLIV